MENEEGAVVDRCVGGSPTDGQRGLCGNDTQPRCTAFGDQPWAWEHGGTSWQEVLYISLQYPTVEKHDIIVSAAPMEFSPNTSFLI